MIIKLIKTYVSCVTNNVLEVTQVIQHLNILQIPVPGFSENPDQVLQLPDTRFHMGIPVAALHLCSGRWVLFWGRFSPPTLLQLV
ncbi:hypothetical protein HanXRQr2_Chr11g0471691 [Helianthus annuus]|uniref:Uncharacterized protein n=1 Tax=Helianthus annuus TaxID=4232 RepID=A0A9K3HLD7_HELAN|nr:hypothetical protein HanXRQr2_Chr11g0471691 [Helianthus annuus]